MAIISATMMGPMNVLNARTLSRSRFLCAHSVAYGEGQQDRQGLG